MHAGCSRSRRSQAIDVDGNASFHGRWTIGLMRVGYTRAHGGRQGRDFFQRSFLRAWTNVGRPWWETTYTSTVSKHEVFHLRCAFPHAFHLLQHTTPRHATTSTALKCACHTPHISFLSIREETPFSSLPTEGASSFGRATAPSFGEISVSASAERGCVCVWDVLQSTWSRRWRCAELWRALLCTAACAVAAACRRVPRTATRCR